MNAAAMISALQSARAELLLVYEEIDEVLLPQLGPNLGHAIDAIDVALIGLTEEVVQ